MKLSVAKKLRCFPEENESVFQDSTLLTHFWKQISIQVSGMLGREQEQ